MASEIKLPTKWIRLDSSDRGIVATCMQCHETRQWSTTAPDKVYLDEIVDAMTDHVVRNHT